MSVPAKLELEFVESFPDEPKDGILYVSMIFASVMHMCCCGCGNQVVTPLSPTDWELTFDGEAITLYPSVGSWGFPCQSHYWIRQSCVEWAPSWSQYEVEAGRARDRAVSDEFFRKRGEVSVNEIPSQETPPVNHPADTATKPLWQKIVYWFSRKRENHL